MEQIKKIALFIDTVFESIALIGLASMILVVTLQVVTRKLFNFVFFWSEEVTLLLLVWFSFMGMAIGFREGLHLGMDSLVDYLPQKIQRGIEALIEVCIFGFGTYLIIYGWEFTVLMHDSTLAATKLPNSIIYFVMPVTGLMTCVYAALHLAGVNTKRHKGNEIEMGAGLGGRD
ncbi:MAG: TRAP transporter small permease [Negativicutes bacterium]|nr:TRAP transporter small permease [Negativicutes bacterium]